MIDISIIVPVYNVEKYLITCIDSILQQTILNFELILVNDGSTDSCGQICDEYQKLDKRVVVIHKENGGLSSARNAGLDVARGNYIAFVDSDDYISKDMYEILFNNIKKYDACISICGRNLFKLDSDLNTLEHKNKDQYENEELYSNEDALYRLFYLKGFDMSVCDKLYKKELFDNLRFPINRISEDTFVIYKLFSKSNKVVVDLKNKKYYYRQRIGSITKSNFSDKDLDCIFAAKECIDYVRLHHKDLEKSANAFYYLVSLSTVNKFFRYKNVKLEDEIDKIIKKLKENLWNIILDKNITKQTKLRILLLTFNKRVYEILYKFHIKNYS